MNAITDLTPVVHAAVTLTVALISAFLIPWLRRKTTQQDRETLLAWVEIAVAAAQQLYYGLTGSQRKEYVLDFLQSKGYDICSAEVDNAIEAAVLRLHRELEAGA